MFRLWPISSAEVFNEHVIDIIFNARNIRAMGIDFPRHRVPRSTGLWQDIAVDGSSSLSVNPVPRLIPAALAAPDARPAGRSLRFSVKPSMALRRHDHRRDDLSCRTGALAAHDKHTSRRWPSSSGASTNHQEQGADHHTGDLDRND